jgi:hypothetical protein
VGVASNVEGVVPFEVEPLPLRSSISSYSFRQISLSTIVGCLDPTFVDIHRCHCRMSRGDSVRCLLRLDMDCMGMGKSVSIETELTEPDDSLQRVCIALLAAVTAEQYKDN